MWQWLSSSLLVDSIEKCLELVNPTVHYMNIMAARGGSGGTRWRWGCGEGPSINYAGDWEHHHLPDHTQDRSNNDKKLYQTPSLHKYSHFSRNGENLGRWVTMADLSGREWMLLFDNADDPNINLFPFFLDAHMATLSSPRETQLGHGPQSYSKVGDMDETNAIDLLLLRAVKEKTIETLSRLQRLLSFKQLSNGGGTVSTTLLIAAITITFQRQFLKQAAEWKTNDAGQEAQISQAAKEFLQNFLDDIRDTLSIHPLVHSRCQDTLVDDPIARECMTDIIGMSLAHTANLEGTQRQSHLKALCWRTRKHLLGADHPDRLWAMANMAANIPPTWKVQRGRATPRHCVEKRKQLLGADHPDSLWAMANLAATYRQLGRYQEAEPLKALCWRSGSSSLEQTIRTPWGLWYQEAEPLEGTALEKRKQLLGSRPSRRPVGYGKSGCHIPPNLEGTKRQSHLKALCWRSGSKLLGADHPDSLWAMANLAATYRQLGSSLEADHPDTLWAMESLAATYRQLGRYQEAERLEGTVLEKRKQLLGAEHPHTLEAMTNLAATYCQLGRYQEAEQLEGAVLEKQEQLLGADHPDTLLAMAHLAATYCQLGRYKEAEPLESTVLEKRKHLLGADHPDTLWAMENLAATYHQLGRYQEAEPLEGTVLEKGKQLLGADHPHTLEAMTNLAATYRQLGRYKEAEPLDGTVLEKRKYKEAEPLESTVLEKRKQLLGADHPHTLWAMEIWLPHTTTWKRQSHLMALCWRSGSSSLEQTIQAPCWLWQHLAATYCQLGRYKEAEPLESTVLEKRKYQEAEPLEGTVLEKRNHLLGADHPDTPKAMTNLAATYHQTWKVQRGRAN
ncbi:hypothetical protein B0H14DRAFT_2654628 [Mycena olivaceomarginata]|nr:hypothetical protein B0H14DRAFT_2654628 [Mycena olivaceomarginata]